MIPEVPGWIAPLIRARAALSSASQSGLLSALLTSYASSIARVLSWAIAAAVVYRYQGADELAVLMLLRGMVGLLSYMTAGLTPSLVHALSRPSAVITLNDSDGPLDYEPVTPRQTQPTHDTIFNTALIVVICASGVAAAAAFFYASHLDWFHQIAASQPFSATAQDAYRITLGLAMAVILRSLSEVPAAKLQATGGQTFDNVCQIAAELLFMGRVLVFARHSGADVAVSDAFAMSSIGLVLMRFSALGLYAKFAGFRIDLRVVPYLLAMGAWVTLSQIADWFYAPFNQVLIDRYLDTSMIARYVPAIQIDGAMLLLVSGIAVALLPRAASMFHDANWAALRRDYIYGTAVSLLLLAAGAVVVCLIDGWLFQKWFGNPLVGTQEILPWVMVHTVIGGSASIGRSVLFGMGRMKPYAITAIVGGVSNAVLASIVVTTTDWGLKGIIWVTIFTVFCRCALWLPWYTLRAIRAEARGRSLAPAA
ncbi:MAG: hypothetical protein H7144_02180 [Burkholderiales bacterium]|nr:hypothetical protein [Phycisphaerae bacterium]